MAEDAKIEIATRADTGGAEKAAAALGKVNAEAKRGADQAQATAKAANELGESFEKGAAAGRVLGEVAQGNVLALGQLGAAVKGLATLLRTNLIGGLITLGAVAFQVFAPLIKGWMDAKKATEDGGRAVDEFREKTAALAAANKEALEQVKANAEQATKAYKDLSDMIGDAKRRQDELNDAALAEKMADIDAAEQRALANAPDDAAKADIKTRFQRQRVDVRLNAEEAKIANDVYQAQLIEDAAQRTKATARGEIEAARGQVGEAATAVDTAGEARRSARDSGASLGVLASLAADYRAAVVRLEAAEARLADVEREQGGVIDTAQADIDRASQTRQIAARRQGALESTRAATTTSRDAEDRQARTAAVSALVPQLLSDVAEAQGKTFFKSQPELVALNKALSDAVRAAGNDGTTNNEAVAVVSTLEKLVAALEARGIATTTLVKRLDAIEGRITRMNN